MKKYLSAIMIMAAVIGFSACIDDAPCDCDSSSQFYYNSFETAIDLAGWTGLDTSDLALDACPVGSKRSLLIGGGCLQPVASYMAIVQSPGYYSLALWGKSFEAGMQGNIILSNGHSAWDSLSADIAINSPDWHYYQTSNKVKCLHGDTLFIAFLVGGIKYDAVYIDNLSITRAL